MKKCYLKEKGLYFEANLGFNCVTITLYVNKRVAQSTQVVIKTNSRMLLMGVEICHNWDKYYYHIDSREFSGFPELKKFFTDSIISVDRNVNLSYYNTSKVAEEIYKSLC